MDVQVLLQTAQSRERAEIELNQLKAELATLKHYLSVVRHWIDSLAGRACLQWDWDEALEKDAIRWATGRGNRNGRCAYQYARQWVGSKLLERRD